MYKSIGEACDVAIRVVSDAKVDRKAATVYKKYYPMYQELYRSLKDDFKGISALVAST